MNLLEIAQKLSEDPLSWASESIGSFNGNQVEVRVMRHAIAKWHTHPRTDEMFVVLSGSVAIDTEKGSFDLKTHDCLVVKAGTQHRARTESTATLMTLMKATT
ncbi:cupin domain-containing protein [Acaryochloris sp. IP29b_bin.148]|uniref:cupin domain-containing protein n=1 Tax=Acaryochloris sp. IP29b_bin.148 TaxID=2969218 RepID=UPI00262E9A2F|nr:cupin domain-containing protein [Acaryochloris sp. IP29b_bin.148]